MKDRDFLIWIHERLQFQNEDHPMMDFMHKLRAIIKATPADQETQNVASSPEDLCKLSPSK